MNLSYVLDNNKLSDFNNFQNFVYHHSTVKILNHLYVYDKKLAVFYVSMLIFNSNFS